MVWKESSDFGWWFLLRNWDWLSWQYILFNKLTYYGLSECSRHFSLLLLRNQISLNFATTFALYNFLLQSSFFCLIFFRLFLISFGYLIDIVGFLIFDSRRMRLQIHLIPEVMLSCQSAVTGFLGLSSFFEWLFFSFLTFVTFWQVEASCIRMFMLLWGIGPKGQVLFACLWTFYRSLVGNVSATFRWNILYHLLKIYSLAYFAYSIAHEFQSFKVLVDSLFYKWRSV